MIPKLLTRQVTDLIPKVVTSALVPSTSGLDEKIILRQRRRLKRGLTLLGIFVGLPTLFGAIYYALIASDIYVSKAQMTVRSVSVGRPSVEALLSGAIGGIGGNGSPSPETGVVMKYLSSMEVTRQLDEMVNMESVFSVSGADFVASLKKSAPLEEKWEYYKSMVDVNLDYETGVVELTVRAFGPNDAQKVAQTLVDLSERMVNNMSHKMKSDSLDFVRRELAEAEQRFKNARIRMADFRNEHGDLDPQSTAVTLSGIAAELYKELVATRTELAHARTYMRENTVKIRSLEARIRSLENQFLRERNRLAGNSNNETFTELLYEYQELMIDLELSQRLYETALAAFETVKADSARQHLYLVPVAPPSLPEKAEEPRRVRSILIVGLVALMSFAVLALVVSTIREHAKV